MKNLFLLFAFVGISKVAKSQGNLQFNQVITQTGSVAIFGQGWIGSSLFTVPDGKVWKIENILGSTSTSLIRHGIYINGALGIYESSLSNATAGFKSNAPIWLKAGDQLQFAYFGPNAGSNNSCSFIISIIEFNVVP